MVWIRVGGIALNIDYYMQKSRYKFTYDNKIMLYDVSKLPAYRRELSLFIKELYLYNISLKSLSKEKVRPIIKDELLNMAAICAENEETSTAIRVNRCVPVKELSSISGKSQKFFEKWQNHILAYFILLSNDDYSSIVSYLNIKRTENSMGRIDKENNMSQVRDPSSVYSDDISGIVLKKRSKKCYVLTQYGDFMLLYSPEDESVGEICTGSARKERDFFTIPMRLIFIVIVLVAAVGFYSYTHVDRTVVIKGGFYVELDVNRWNRIINVTGLNTNGNEIKQSVKLFNNSLDSAIVSLLDAGIKDKYISENNQVNVFITSDSKNSLSLESTKKYITSKKLKVVINNDGNDIPLNNK